MTVDKEALKKKLAEFAGFRQGQHYTDNYYRGNYRWRAGETFWVRPNIPGAINLPDFPNDFNACLKYLWPVAVEKYAARGIELLDFYDPGLVKYCTIETLESRYPGDDRESFAMAFCLAIEKLIDAEGTNES